MLMSGPISELRRAGAAMDQQQQEQLLAMCEHNCQRLTKL